jgi:hypothetical protein
LRNHSNDDCVIIFTTLLCERRRRTTNKKTHTQTTTNVYMLKTMCAITLSKPLTSTSVIVKANSPGKEQEEQCFEFS